MKDMTKPQIKILIRVIGIYNESVIQFLKDYKIGKLYIIHKVTTEKDHTGSRKVYDFKKISEEFLDKLNNEWSEVTVIPKVLKDSQDFHEIQKLIGDIVETENMAEGGMLNTLEDVGIDFTGGTGIIVAGQLFSAFKLRVTPYYVQPDTVRKNNRVEKISINYRLGREMGTFDTPANKILKNLANSKFTVRGFKGRTFFETPEGLDAKPVMGMKTQMELYREFKESGMRRIDTHLNTLIAKNLIEQGIGFSIYRNMADDGEEEDWKPDKLPVQKYYKITEAGKTEVRILEYGDV